MALFEALPLFLYTEWAMFPLWKLTSAQSKLQRPCPAARNEPRATAHQVLFRSAHNLKGVVQNLHRAKCLAWCRVRTFVLGASAPEITQGCQKMPGGINLGMAQLEEVLVWQLGSVRIAGVVTSWIMPSQSISQFPSRLSRLQGLELSQFWSSWQDMTRYPLAAPRYPPQFH